MQKPEDFISFIVFGIVFIVLSVNVSASSSYQRDEYISSWVDEDGDCQKEKQRQAMASKIGFDAYGMTSDMPDPIAQSLKHMLDHMHAVDKKISAMSNALEKMGTDCGKQLPEIRDDLFQQDNKSETAVDLVAKASKVD